MINKKDKHLYAILTDYHNCSHMKDCETCQASEEIPETETTYCQFLGEHKIYVENAIEQLLSEVM